MKINFFNKSSSLKGILSGNKAKGQIPNGCCKKTKHVIFSEKLIFLTSWYAHVRVSVREQECSSFEKFGKLCFLVTFVLRFALLRFYRRTILQRFERYQLWKTEKLFRLVGFRRAVVANWLFFRESYFIRWMVEFKFNRSLFLMSIKIKPRSLFSVPPNRKNIALRNRLSKFSMGSMYK